MGGIPVLHVEGDCIARAWENSLLELYHKGCDIKTQYDKPDDPPSKDATMIITIADPLKEPMIHKDFPGGPEDLQEYVMEVCEGIKDHLVRDPNDPEDTRWEYTYHSRIFAYDVPNEETFDQIEIMCQKLAKTPYTRRAQAITWKVWEDNTCYDPACFCAGSMVKTPYGEIPIEKLKDGALVYAYELHDGGLIHGEVSNFFTKDDDCFEIRILEGRSICVSKDQLLLSKRGWQKAQDISEDDKVFVNSSCSISEISDAMLAGFFHGDGWLSTGVCGGKRRIKRCNVCFGIHHNADDTWIYEFIAANSLNKPLLKQRYIKTEQVPRGGLSKKIVVTDREIWERFVTTGIPVGRKAGAVKWSPSSKKELADFLTGIFSAEGCVYLGSKPSIQIGMNWGKCIDFVAEALDRFGIHYTRHKNGKTHKLYISDNENIRQCFDIFDFRLDSRKQARFLLLRASFIHSDRELESRVKHVHKLQELRRQGYSLTQLREIKPFNARMLDKDYTPTLRLRILDRRLARNCGVFLPVESKIDIGRQTVYDFEVDHDDHAIIVNGIVSHNCLQSLWCRLTEENDELVLNMNVRFRSNDAYKAAFMNIFALVQLQQKIAKRVSELSGKPVKVGRYCHMVDSYHLYGSYFEEFERRFLNLLKKRTFEKRTMRYEDFREIMEAARPVILEKARNMQRKEGEDL